MSSRPPKQLRQRRYDPLAVLSYIAAYQQTHRERTPSQRQIQAALAISAPSVVHGIVHRLQHAGLLRVTSYGRGRTVDLALTEAGHAAVQRWQAERSGEEQC